MNNGYLISRGLKKPREELIILKQPEEKLKICLLRRLLLSCRLNSSKQKYTSKNIFPIALKTVKGEFFRISSINGGQILDPLGRRPAEVWTRCGEGLQTFSNTEKYH